MTLDIRARATAQRLLAKFGKACTLKRITAGVYDPDTGAVAQTVATYPVHIYLDAPRQQELDAGQVVMTDEIAIFAASALAVDPVIGDTLTIDSTDRTIKMVTRTWSGEQVALWRVGVSS